MNEPDPASPLDLRFLPSWLKEENSAPNYANHPGGDESQRRDRPGQRGNHPPGERNFGERGRNPGGSGPARDNRGPGGPSRPGFKPGGGKSGERPPPSRGPRPDHGPRRDGPHQERPQEAPPTVNIQFLPEEIALAKVTEQMLASAAAYPLFGVARMFLQRPERHHLRFAPVGGKTLWKIKGTSQISTDRPRLEAIAFKETKDQWFKIEVSDAGEIKGNFTSVARSTLTGKIFGPTNHHTFQSAIRREYEERFSRRMSFPEYRSKIETSSDPALVEQWKEESRKVEKYLTIQAEPEQSFASALEAELYFKKEILPDLLVESNSETLPGPDTHEIQDQRIIAAMRQAWDKEMKFPLGMVNEIRNHLQKSNLHIFKYKKRVLLVSTIRPIWLDDKSQNLSASIQSILAAVREKPGINRKELVERLLVLPGGESTDETPSRKIALIGDLHWLISQGNIMEFADGTLDLPLSPKYQENSVELPLKQSQAKPALDVTSSEPESEPALLERAPEIMEIAAAKTLPQIQQAQQ